MSLTLLIIAVITLAAIGLVAGVGLSIASRRLPANADDLIERVNNLLPQTQCAQCGYPGCRPYAKAVVDASADINLCPPGGEETVRRLATLLGRTILPLARCSDLSRAVIDESRCIGCTHCRNACPVDAIVGAHQLMHTVLGTECTGCELCLAPCPVDCISMQPVS